MKVTLNREALKSAIKRKLAQEIATKINARPWKHENQLWNGTSPAMWLYSQEEKTDYYTPAQVTYHKLNSDYSARADGENVTLNLIFSTSDVVEFW